MSLNVKKTKISFWWAMPSRPLRTSSGATCIYSLSCMNHAASSRTLVDVRLLSTMTYKPFPVWKLITNTGDTGQCVCVSVTLTPLKKMPSCVTCSRALQQGRNESRLSVQQKLHRHPEEPDGRPLSPPDRTLPPGGKFTRTQPVSPELPPPTHTHTLMFVRVRTFDKHVHS